ncbi:hypothetical protein [Bradyrhizobium sp. 6(2017)]|uniref:hypothetical protein n=1 Tax=Bradyrhizobium sp. 6(2017) TaxID=1197460 RepID=UPI0013E15F7C|nr:hypothetical protein [Bradyrhizobium sp. 6(2017)]QIG91087.1 hypothetical protein G6P99_00160 [Bradyrhizobium sp. 6(2017)]
MPNNLRVDQHGERRAFDGPFGGLDIAIPFEMANRRGYRSHSLDSRGAHCDHPSKGCSHLIHGILKNIFRRCVVSADQTRRKVSSLAACFHGRSR